MAFGQWLGNLFKNFHPLKAYTIEIGGSILGIIAFALMSYLHCGPIEWFIVGFIIVFLIIDVNKKTLFGSTAFIAALILTVPFIKQFYWSPYYKISVSKINTVRAVKDYPNYSNKEPFGYEVAVNNDYHQMILDIKAREEEHAFFKSWGITYNLPYKAKENNHFNLPANSKETNLEEKPILIVGAGTGNDVSAALRKTNKPIDAVEIDPAIVSIGKALHFEHPYDNGRVNLIVNDARSFFTHTNKKYSHIVFGFLDSHTLLSSFSSLRLDNFVYTKQSMEKTKELLLPEGRVFLTFA
ncbi:Spermine synthase, partial [Candidatus Magnetoovum chiemensis]